MLRRRGVVDSVAERLAAEEAKPLGEHVKDFLAALRGAKRTEKHARLAEARIRRIIGAVGAQRLSDLTPESFNLTACPPTATVEAGYSKRRRQDVQPLPRGLAEALGPWLAGKEAGRPVFNLPDKTAKMLRHDLDAAGIPYATAEGVADFHCLRHCFVSRLVRSGVNVKIAQELARHSTPVLTLGRYAHVDMQDKALALAMVPALEAPRVGAGVPERAAPGAALLLPELALGGTDMHDGQRIGGSGESGNETPGTARIADPGISYDGGGRGIRTLNLRVMNPLL